MELPRFFLPSDHDVDGPERAPIDPAYVLDTFVHIAGDLTPREVMTGLDPLGALALVDVDDRGDHLGSIRSHLAHAEVANPLKRQIETAVGGLWLMAVELLEQLPDAPGPNDPVYLYGTLWSAASAGEPGRRGQLTTTRGDVLRGLVEGERWAFRYPPDEGERVPRCFHLLLPGDRAEAVGQGQGIVLAYPAMDPDLLGSHAGNEIQVLSLYHDILAALVGDSDHAGSDDVLPVPDANGFVKDLVDEGWTISADGRTATREPADAGFFKRLFRGRETLTLPAQASVEAYGRRARAELERLHAWPTAASAALFSRVGPHAGGALGRRAERPIPARTPPRTQEPQGPTPPPPRPPTGAVRRASRDEWMRDFVAEHKAHRPQLTTVRPLPPPAPLSRPGRPDWMKDFD